jgi:chorismate dehydratase
MSPLRPASFAQGKPLRLGAVSYLNTRPLVYGLDARPDQFTVRFDVPSQCAARLEQGEVDLGLVPTIEYLRGDYRFVPDVAIVSDGPVASVAIFSRVPIDRVRTLALDTSSRTSVALTRILCARHWRIAPTFRPAAPDLDRMLADADAALVIGDLALASDASRLDAAKIDLGEIWKAFTGLPFVYAAWTGRPGAATPEQCAALGEARDRGVNALDEIARHAAAGDAALAPRLYRYLRDNLSYRFGDAEAAGLARFLELAVELGLAGAARSLAFYDV